ncbi:hypothetical protein QJS10_CPB11g00873 [Acorus calamus]|uniref:Carbamoyl phosphate synthase ATP-binding domain-containing protein n=1 Tax=Acorus calamus TaxID=4465 RepID=A0AAV9DRN2_ACOCL|nr:hypothetical protein QJS10_CPB11g00873 [Acorus calamus]
MIQKKKVQRVWYSETRVHFKATAGGGGRGMRLAKEPEEFVKLLHTTEVSKE